MTNVIINREIIFRFKYYFPGTQIFKYSHFQISKRKEIDEVCHTSEKRGAYRILVGRPDGRRPLARPRRRWEDNIKIDLQDVRSVHGLDCSFSE